MSELILVRHGQASFGAESYDKLSAMGLQQAQALAQHWLGTGERFDVLYTGSLRRQQETADALLPTVNSTQAIILDALNEYNGESLLRIYFRDHARLEGFADGMTGPIKDRKTFQLALEAATRHWLNGTLTPQIHDTDFEPWKHFQSRVHTTLDELMQRHTGGARVLISTSGGVIALALQRALMAPDNHTLESNWMVYNSSVTRIVYGRGKVSLSSFNALPHLAAPAMRELVTYR